MRIQGNPYDAHQNAILLSSRTRKVAQRISTERLRIEEALTAAQEELAGERALRARAERERDEAFVAAQTAEQRLRQTTAVKAAAPPPCLTTSLGAGAVGLRRSCGKLSQTIRILSNGGHPGGRKNTGSTL
jgi:hypothetical protein